MIFLKPYCITRPISSRTVLEDAKRITRPVSSRTILEDAFHFFIRHASLSTTPLHIIQSFSLPSQHKPYHRSAKQIPPMAETLSPNPAMGRKQRLRIQSPTSPFVLGSNNDQLERARARDARAAANRRKSLALNQPLQANSHPGLNKQQILDLFQNCIKLASENVKQPPPKIKNKKDSLFVFCF